MTRQFEPGDSPISSEISLAVREANSHDASSLLFGDSKMDRGEKIVIRIRDGRNIK